MDDTTASKALASLGQEHRIRIFRILMRAGPLGLAAGEIAGFAGLAPSALSFHAAHLENAGLLRSWRVGRHVFYAVAADGVQRLLAFLTEECCDGRPELCGGLAGFAFPRCEPGGDRAMNDNRVFNVLFLCHHNSARSIMAEAILARLGIGRFRAFSAGKEPRGTVHPYTLDLLRANNHPVDELRSKSWDAFAGPEAPRLDFVFSVCEVTAGEICPAWPGQPMTAHWSVPDPAAASGREAERRLAFADAYRMLNTRIGIFASLPVSTLDKLTLQRHLDQIGAAQPNLRRAPA
jgi:ArsR family transcriptional regulator, arsenate/arsenite/antimonite-responsive transcriptional repressor / arsenate reductase (thioredoxin)